uniref:Uncharacterized protein n=1 Tax=Mucochytrium quahogii TaxID=96639 RepID=A0A7S2RJY7_9STRA
MVHHFFGTPEIGADLSAALPKASVVLYDAKGMYNAVKDGCFTLAPEERTDTKAYSFSTVQGYKTAAKSASNIEVSGKGEYLVSSVSASYTSSQDTEQKVNNQFSYAKAHVKSELQIATVVNNCMGAGRGMAKYMTESSRMLWRALKADPDNQDIARAFNEHFRALQTSKWSLGGLYAYDMKVTLMENSELDTEAMDKGIKAAANIKVGAYGAEMELEMSKAFTRETEKTSMKTKFDFVDTGIAPCPELATFLRTNRTDKSELEKKIKKAFQDDFQAWTPHRSIGYTSSLEMMLAAEGGGSDSNLQAKLAQALFEENVSCNQVKVRGFRLIRNLTEGEDGTLTLTCKKPNPNNVPQALCKFERGAGEIVLERTSGDYGMLNQHTFLIHYVGSKDYHGVAEGILSLCKGNDLHGHLCAVKYDVSFGTSTFGTFGYNGTHDAFTYTGYAQTEFKNAAHRENVAEKLNLQPEGEYYRNSDTRLYGYHYFLNRDARFVGHSPGHAENQHTYLQHVNGIRPSIDGTSPVLCNE